MQRFFTVRWVFGCGLILGGILSIALPEQFAARAYLLSDRPGANLWLIYGVGIALIALGIATVAEPAEGTEAAPPPIRLLIALLSVVYFLVLTAHLRFWWIDDAGITFAYSRSLAEGHGLVAQPWLPPEEGYSSSTWMLLLSFMSRLGADIPLAAKYLGIGFSAACMGLCAWIISRETGSLFALLLCGIGIACSSTVVWAVSGQEHALQSLVLLAVVVCVYGLERWRWPVALLLALLVLTRPEAPIIVIAVFCAAVLLTRRAGGPLFNAGDAAVALVPFAAFVLLILFRVLYFGDPMPNPYYAKSSGAGLIGIFNPLGGGWTYILSGLRDTALFFVLWLAFVSAAKKPPPWFVIAVAILIGHAAFVIWAKGDWMGQYRFLMPVLPILLLVVCAGLKSLPSARVRACFSIAAVLVLVHTNTLQLAAFRAMPTTSLTAVTKVGNTFRDLSDRLAIEDPLLAHHDAGGIAYHRMVRLVDLGGLINRKVAQNMDDPAFLLAYLLEDTQPDFVFGGWNFAAASGFFESADFTREYVPLEFAGLRHMRNDISYIRRSRVAAAPGIEPLYDDTGRLTAVRVMPQGLKPDNAGST